MSAVVMFMLLLLGCGGGGSSSPDPVVAPPPPPVPPIGPSIPVRNPNPNCLAPPSQQQGAISLVPAFSNLPSLNGLLGLFQPPGDSSQWFAMLRDGLVVRFDNSPSASATQLVLDITGKVSTFFEMGLTGFAFHPDYPTDNRFFVLYNDLSNNQRSTLSSFAVSNNVAANEQVLLTLEQPAGNHNGGNIAFGNDGMLYLAFGDGGADRNTSQNLNTLHGKMLRLDVSNPVAYSIPVDNPFNQGQGFCATGQGNGTCPEIYAYGFRNPWRWGFDRQSGDLWLADVGQSTLEEVDRVISGGNYGWPIMEGSQCFQSSSCNQNNLQLPIAEYGRSQGTSIAGGFVYRSMAVTALFGRYLFADTFAGTIWTLPGNASTGTEETELIAGSGLTIASFAQGNDGAVLVLNMNGSSGQGIYRFEAVGAGLNIPATLSATGCFDTANKTAVSGTENYAVNSELWSDGAAKLRVFALPDSTQISITTNDDFEFPVGSVLIKHFLNNDTYLETRLFMHHDLGWRGYSYEWRSDQSDADLLDVGKVINVNGFSHIIPSRGQCFTCHTDAAGVSLGLEVAQLNRDITFPNQATANHLSALVEQGFISDTLDPSVAVKLFSVEDGAATLADRARSYLHSNCSQCHRPGSGTDNMDFRFDTAFTNMGVCDQNPTSGNLGIINARRLAPGDSAASIIVARMARRGDDQMPPLATALVDDQAVQVVSDWIDSLTGC